MRTRRIVLTGAVGVVGLSLAALTLNSRAEDKAPAAPPPQAVTVAPVPEREISDWDEFTGRLEAVDRLVERTIAYVQRPAGSPFDPLRDLEAVHRGP